MLEVVICDDDKEDLDKATLMLDKILSEYQVQYQIRSFLSANELLNSNDTGYFHGRTGRNYARKKAERKKS